MRDLGWKGFIAWRWQAGWPKTFEALRYGGRPFVPPILQERTLSLALALALTLTLALTMTLTLTLTLPLTLTLTPTLTMTLTSGVDLSCFEPWPLP